MQLADKTGMWIYINQAGKQAIRQAFLEARDFSEGLAPISTFPYWGFMDTAGRIRVQPRYASVGAFVQGRANVTFRRPYKASRSGYIDVFGILVIPDTFEQGSDFLPSGRAAVFVVRGEQFAKGYAGWGSLAYIDTSGQILWPKEAR